jgi:hypothetical protein
MMAANTSAKKPLLCNPLKLPRELREKILEPLLTESGNGQIYAIIKASRSKRTFYSEALAIFTKVQAFELRRSNN